MRTDTVIRTALGAVGVGFGLWGVWLMRDFSFEQLLSTGIWLAGGILLHDAVLAPLTVALGVAASRLLPGHYRAATGLAFLVWATLTITFIPVLSGQGGKPDNDTLLDQPYLISWLVLTGVLAGAAVIAAQRRKRRVTRPADADAG
jgi:hypothetical protein